MKSGEFPRRRRWLHNPWVHVALIFLLAFFVRLQNLSETVHTPFFSRLNFLSDAVYYHKWAGEIAEGDLLGKKVFYLAPLYPYTLAIPFYLNRKPASQGSKGGLAFQYSNRAALTWQCAVGALSACLIYAIGSFLGGPWVGLLAGLLAAFHRMFIYFDALLMPSSQLLFVNLAAVLLLLHAGRKGNWFWWLGAGVSIGLSVLAKAPAVLYLPAGFLWIFFGLPGVPRRRRIRNLVLLSLPPILMVATVTVRNWVVAHDLVFLTANAGTNLYLGNHPEANGAHSGRHLPYRSGRLVYYSQDLELDEPDPPPSQVSRELSAMAWGFIREDPLRALALFWRKFRLFFNKVEIGTRDQFYFFQRYSGVLRWPTPGFGIIAPLGLVGLLLALRRWRKYLPLLALFFIPLITCVLVFVLGRLRFPSVAALMVFAALYLQWLFQRLKAKRAKPAAASLLLVAGFGWFVSWPVPGMGPGRGMGNQDYLLATIQASSGKSARAALEEGLTLPWQEGYASERMHKSAYRLLAQIYLKEDPAKAIPLMEEAIRWVSRVHDPDDAFNWGGAYRDLLEKARATVSEKPR